jgi:type IV pilus assembly protein PilE
MVALVIISVLAAIAYPSYQNYTLRANRADGYAVINTIMQAEERFFAEEVTYTADLTDLGFAAAANVGSPEGLYQVTAAACGGGTIADCVLLTAVPQGAQAGDGNLTLNSRGTRTGNW